MKRTPLLLLLSVFFLILSCNETKNQNTMKFEYPETKKVDTTDTYFGVEVADPYRWLEDDNSEETKAWVIAQNEVTFNYLHEIPFRQKLIDRLTEIYNYERYSTPFKKGKKYFFFKNDGLQNQSVLYIQDDIEAEATELLDPNKLSEDGTVALAGTAISKDGKYLAYSIARSGSDWNEIYVKNIETKEILSDHIEWVKFSGTAWYKDGFFYSCYEKPEEGTELTKASEIKKFITTKLELRKQKTNSYFKIQTNLKEAIKHLLVKMKKYLYYPNGNLQVVMVCILKI